MKLDGSVKRFALLPALLLGLALFAPAMAGAGDWWNDDEGVHEEGDVGWWGDEYDDDFGEAGLEGDEAWWEDDEYGFEDQDYVSDDYGYYDTDYDWDTDEGWFSDW